MSDILVPSGTSLILRLQLFNGDTTKYPQVSVFNNTPAEIVGSPFNLTHASGGLYYNNAVAVADGKYTARYTVYNEVGHNTIAEVHGRPTDAFDVTPSESQIAQVFSLVDVAVSTRESESDAATRATAGAKEAALTPVASNVTTLVGRLTSTRATNLDYLNASVSSRESEADAFIRAGVMTAVKAKTDNLTFTGSNVNAAIPPSGISDMVDGVWNATQAGHNAPGSMGAEVNRIDEIETKIDAIPTSTSAFAAAIWDANRSSHTAAGTFGESSQGVVSTARAANLDKLDVNVSTRSPLSTAVSSVDLSITRIQNLDNLDAAMTSRASQSSVTSGFAAGAKDVTVAKDATVAKELTLDGVVTVEADIQSTVDILENRLTATRALKLDLLDATVSSRESESDASARAAAGAKDATVAKEVTLAAVNTKIGTPVSSVSVDIASVKADTGVIRGQTTTTGVVLSGAAEDGLVNKVWDEPISGHLISGSTGQELDTAASAAAATITPTDLINIKDAVWDAALVDHVASGSMGANQNLIDESATAAQSVDTKLSSSRALKLDNLDAPVSSRESESLAGVRAASDLAAHATTLAAVGGVQSTATGINTKLGTPVGASVSADIASVNAAAAAINAKTTNLPTDPASNTAITAGIAPVASEVSAVHVQTGAIKAKTDNLPALPANQVSVLAIPTNPVLDSDSRLVRLDANVSSRATPADLATLATGAALSSTKSDILAAVAGVDANLTPKATTAQLGAAVAPLATAVAVAAIEVEVLAIAVPTPADTWSYVTRGLTVPVVTTVDLSAVAKTVEVNAARDAVLIALPVQEVKATVAIDPVADTMTVQTWLDIDGKYVTAPASGSIEVRDSAGLLIFNAGPSITPSAEGVFTFTRSSIAALVVKNQAYTINATIVSGGTYSSKHSFTVV